MLKKKKIALKGGKFLFFIGLFYTVKDRWPFSEMYRLNLKIKKETEVRLLSFLKINAQKKKKQANDTDLYVKISKNSKN